MSIETLQLLWTCGIGLAVVCVAVGLFVLIVESEIFLTLAVSTMVMLILVSVGMLVGQALVDAFPALLPF